MTRSDRKWGLWMAVVALGLAAAACGGDANEDAPQAPGADTVGVTLQEWAVVPETDSAAGGEVTFNVSNEGEETHEFVVLQTDLDLTELPTAEDGSLDEEGGPIEVVDELEDIAAGDSVSLTVDLDPGAYVLACNIVEEEDGETESHFVNGMRTAFTVE